MAKTHIASDETLQRIASACELSATVSAINAGKKPYPVWDAEAGEFTNESIKAWLDWNSDGKLYGVDQTLDAVQTCTKVLANAGIENPVPSTLAAVGSDPYWQLGPFRWEWVNATVDDDSVPHITGMRSFGNFTFAKDVFALAPVRYRFEGEVEGKRRLINSDTPSQGLQPEDRSILPSGEVAPFMLRAAFPLSIVDGLPMSVPSGKTALFSVSHNSMITTCAKKGAAYSALTAADDAYLYDMFLLKYAHKSSQSVFAGCTSHSEQTPVTVEATASNTVTVAKSAAGNWPVGSCVAVGTATSAPDRGAANARDLASQANIVSKVEDGENVILTLDCDPFDSAVGNYVSTMPWNPGSCVNVQYDGSPTSCTSGRDPFIMQGIETGIGCYEILGDLVAYNSGDGWGLHIAKTTDKASSSAPTADYLTVCSFGPIASEGWKYPKAMRKLLGAWVPTEFGASTSTGTGDGWYIQADTTTGARCFLSRGYLWSGSHAGLRFAYLDAALSGSWWNYGSRVSVDGLNGVSTA